MYIEKEIKILDINPDDLKQTILSHNGRLIFDTTTYMKWFEVSESSQLFELETIDGTAQDLVRQALEIGSHCSSFRDAAVYFRLRLEGACGDMTIKWRDTTEGKIAHNIEVSYEFRKDLWNMLDTWLEQCEFVCIAVHQKKRTSFDMNIDAERSVRIDIDRWPGIPPYAEIEGESSTDITDAIKLLGLTEHITTTDAGKTFFGKYGVNFYSDLTFDV